MHVVVVESPAKAKTINKYLGKDYEVLASFGHVRDLPAKDGSVLPDQDFAMTWEVDGKSEKRLTDIARAVRGADKLILATDPDREGEAISWHVLEVLRQKRALKDVAVERVVFNAITKQSVLDAMAKPRAIDTPLVEAYLARRALDYLVGFTLSPVLWRKLPGAKSAGRVQSVALRLVCDREAEIERFVAREYWQVVAELASARGETFLARLVAADGKRIQRLDIGGAVEANGLKAMLEGASYRVVDVEAKPVKRHPAPPFTTSTLQQEASRKLGLSPARTMQIAQRLYEGVDVGGETVGLITYMRTDSVSVSTQAQKETRDYVTGRFGKQFLPARPPMYRTRTRGAQEAHEAIRPTRIPRDPASVRSALTNDQYKLYNLIWQRFVASQMANALYNTLRVDIVAGPAAEPQRYGLRASGSIIRFQGFLVLYEDSRDEDLALDEDEGRILPEMTTGELLHLLALQPEQHFTQPPPRFTEASLVRTLEELGIGRPSTYAPTVAVIQDREYVAKEDKRLVPTETGRVVNDLLVSSFPDIFDFQFTARMEDELDDIADGRLDWRPMLGDFYGPFSRDLEQARELLPRVQAEDDDVGRDCPTCGKPLRYRYSKYGKFIGCSDYPNCRYTERIVEKVGVACPTCGTEKGGEIIARRTRTGREFFGCSRYPECEYTSWKRPLPGPCPHCGGMLVLSGRGTARCTVCGKTMRIAEQRAAETA